MALTGLTIADMRAGKTASTPDPLALQRMFCSAPWDETPGKVKANVYTLDKKGVPNGTTTEIYSGVQSASRP
jgi:hypothetical protein